VNEDRKGGRGGDEALQTVCRTEAFNLRSYGRGSRMESAPPPEMERERARARDRN